MDPHYVAKEKFSFPPAFEPKDKTPHPRTYRQYGDFTKRFDKVTNRPS